MVISVRRFIPQALLWDLFEAWWFSFVVLVRGIVHHGEVGVIDLEDHAGTKRWRIGLCEFLGGKCRVGWSYVVAVPAR